MTSVCHQLFLCGFHSSKNSNKALIVEIMDETTESTSKKPERVADEGSFGDGSDVKSEHELNDNDKDESTSTGPFEPQLDLDDTLEEVPDSEDSFQTVFERRVPELHEIIKPILDEVLNEALNKVAELKFEDVSPEDETVQSQSSSDKALSGTGSDADEMEQDEDTGEPQESVPVSIETVSSIVEIEDDGANVTSGDLQSSEKVEESCEEMPSTVLNEVEIENIDEGGKEDEVVSEEAKIKTVEKEPSKFKFNVLAKPFEFNVLAKPFEYTFKPIVNATATEPQVAPPPTVENERVPVEALHSFEVVVKNKIKWESIEERFLSEDITVVTVFGRSRSLLPKFNTAFESLIDSWGMLGLFDNGDEATDPNDIEFNIDGFYNAADSVLFLHLDSADDPKRCINACRQFLELNEDLDFLNVWNTLKSKFCRNLLLLFSLSHIMIWTSIKLHMDTTFMEIFRMIEKVRLKIMPALSSKLSKIPNLDRKWVAFGRLASPRVLFFFEPESKDSVDSWFKLHKADMDLDVKRQFLQMHMFHFLRKSRIITNVSSNSLFSIALMDDYVFILDQALPGLKTYETCHAYYQRTLFDDLNKKALDRTQSTDKSVSPKPGCSSSPVQNTPRNGLHKEVTKLERDHFRTETLRLFACFVRRHLVKARTKGFDDNSQTTPESRQLFVIPSLKNWIKAYKVLHEYIVVGKNDIIDEVLHEYTSVDTTYIETNCEESFTKILSSYYRNLPSLYTEGYHRAKLEEAENSLLAISRRSPVLPYLSKLRRLCELYWRNGRQQCEGRSLLGLPCLHPIHRFPDSANLEIFPPSSFAKYDHLPGEEVLHFANARIITYCNCGHSQVIRDAPFSIREANYSFYERCAKGCCENLEKIDFIPQDPNVVTYSLEEMLNIIQRHWTPPEPIDQFNYYDKIFNRIGIGVVEDVNKCEFEFETTKMKKIETDPRRINTQYGIPNNGRAKKPYLPGMRHSYSPPSLFPLFSSWSLMRLGYSSLYSHNTGLTFHHQPGFFKGTNFLLPWDVKVRNEAGIARLLPRALRLRSIIKPTRVEKEITVKIFFGFEYECSYKGHRFFVESDNKVLQIASIADQREAAAKLADTELPLYFKCPCSVNPRDGTKIAKLMRVHIVTPRAPVYVILEPKVQPGPHPCSTFSPEYTKRIRLGPTSYWVLRLPYSYVNDTHVFTTPAEVRPGSMGRVFRSMFKVVSMNPEDARKWEAANLL